MELQNHQPRYPFLEELLRIKKLTLKPTYTNADVAELFDVSVRTIQSYAAAGPLRSRKLIGRAKYLPVDLEQFLHNSSRDPESSTESDAN